HFINLLLLKHLVPLRAPQVFQCIEHILGGTALSGILGKQTQDEFIDVWCDPASGSYGAGRCWSFGKVPKCYFQNVAFKYGAPAQEFIHDGTQGVDVTRARSVSAAHLLGRNSPRIGSSGAEPSALTDLTRAEFVSA